MKKVIFFILGSLLFSNSKIDTTAKVHAFDFNKVLNIPGIIPEQIPMNEHEIFLFPKEIEAIKQKAKDFDPKPLTNDDIVILETNRGILKLKLFPEIAPKHCRNLKKLANSGFYDGTSFHRIIPGFMIQGGDINSRDNNPD